MRPDELDKAIALVYEASMGEASWNDAFSALGAPFSSGVYAVVWDSLAQRPLFEAVSRDLVQAQPEYHAHYGALDPRRSYTFGLPVGATMACHELFDADYVRASEFYNDYLHRWGWRYAMGCRLHEEDGQSVVIGLQRPSGQGPFQMRERQLLAAAQPHLARAFRVRRVLSRNQDRATRRQAMLDGLQAAALLVVSADGCSSGTWRPSRSCARATGCCSGRVRLAGAHARRDRLPAALGPGRRRCRVAARGRRRSLPPLARRWQLLRRPGDAAGRRDASGCGTPAALVLIADPSRRPLPTEQALRDLYDLTPAEARTARALLAGRGPREIAGQLGVGLGTVRTHLHRIFDKTGTTGQADLVRAAPGVRFAPGLNFRQRHYSII